MQVMIPSTERLAMVNLEQGKYALALAKLIKAPISLTPETVIGDLTAIEADFSGYLAQTVTAAGATFQDQVRGGYSFAVPTVQFDTASTLTVPNTVYGGWFEDATGHLLFAWTTSPGINMSAPLQSIAVDLLENYFNNGNQAQQYVEVNGLPIT